MEKSVTFYTKEQIDEMFNNLPSNSKENPTSNSGNVYFGKKIDIENHTYNYSILDKITSSGNSLQGMCIYKNYMFVLENTGVCTSYILTDNSITKLSTFDLGSKGSKNHANCASFGNEYASGNTLFPLMYVSQCTTGNRKCAVESITKTSSTLVQTISLKSFGTFLSDDADIQYIADAENGFLYVFGNSTTNYTNPSNKFAIAKFKLPKLSEGDVQLDLNDALEKYYMEDYGFHNEIVLQGCCIKNNLMFLPVGNMGGTNCYIYVWDLDGRNMASIIDFNSITDIGGNGEPEDVAIRNAFLYVTTQGGNIYKMSF